MLNAPEITTIKEKLLADIRAGEQDPNVLAKRFGLNGHDLVKNLEQLRKEGFIHLQWGVGDRVQRVRPNKGAANMQLLASSPPPAHQATDSASVVALANAINKLPWRSHEWRAWDTELLRKNSGLTIFQISRATALLREQRRLEQLGGGGVGKRIEGVRWRGERAPDGALRVVPEESATDKPKADSGPSQAVRDTIAYLKAHDHSPKLPDTPHLDQYIEARRAVEALPTNNPYLEVNFEPDPLAEEAILLREALHSARGGSAQGTESRD